MNQQNVLIFDGECSFCSSCVDWLDRNLPVTPKAIPYQWADLDAYGLTRAEAEAQVWLVTPTEHHGGAAAVTAMLRHQPEAALRFLGWALQAPPLSWLGDLAYGLLARFRHVLPGGTPACRR